MTFLFLTVSRLFLRVTCQLLLIAFLFLTLSLLLLRVSRLFLLMTFLFLLIAGGLLRLPRQLLKAAGGLLRGILPLLLVVLLLLCTILTSHKSQTCGSCSRLLLVVLLLFCTIRLVVSYNRLKFTLKFISKETYFIAKSLIFCQVLLFYYTFLSLL